MKLNTRNVTKKKSGMTLLELTVVILVLLSLISILFVGARAWKRGSDRAGCILNIRNMQQAVRSHQNMHSLAEGATIPYATIVGSGAYVETTPDCPGDGDYSVVAGGTFPVTAIGTPVVTCDSSTGDHAPSSTAGW